jgi:hypothetical protein
MAAQRLTFSVACLHSGLSTGLAHTPGAVSTNAVQIGGVFGQVEKKAEAIAKVSNSAV